jgi:hypothetical protein
MVQRVGISTEIRGHASAALVCRDLLPHGGFAEGSRRIDPGRRRPEGPSLLHAATEPLGKETVGVHDSS